jgi:hypothetical protein
MRRSDSKDAKQQNGSRTARSVWSARSLLPLWAARHRSKAPALHTLRAAGNQGSPLGLWTISTVAGKTEWIEEASERLSRECLSSAQIRPYVGGDRVAVRCCSVVVPLYLGCISVVRALFSGCRSIAAYLCMPLGRATASGETQGYDSKLTAATSGQVLLHQVKTAGEATSGGHSLVLRPGLR